MFEHMIESSLGTWGAPVLDFVRNNGFIISAVVIAIWAISVGIAHFRKKKHREK